MQGIRRVHGAISATHMSEQFYLLALSYELLNSLVPLLAAKQSPFKQCLHFLERPVSIFSKEK